jgi:hypothetical protein
LTVKTIGIIATGATTALAALAVVLGVRSIPDIKRYLKIRNM